MAKVKNKKSKMVHTMTASSMNNQAYAIDVSVVGEFLRQDDLV